MRDFDKALIDIANIRNQIAVGTEFQGFGPAVIALTGVLAGFTALLQSLWPQLLAWNGTVMLIGWCVLAIFCVSIISIEMIARSRRHHGGLADAMLANAVEQFLPAGVAGATIGAVMIKYSPQTIWMLPGLWQVCFALGIFAAVRSLPRLISLVGGWYFLSGICVLILASFDEMTFPWMMGFPFLIGQLLMGLLLRIASKDTQDE